MPRPRLVSLLLLLPFVMFALLTSLLLRADNYPPGTYRDMSKPTPFGGGCLPIEFKGGRLVAECPNFFGFMALTSLDSADKCVNDKHDIENVNGTLRCVISSQRVNGSHPYTADVISFVSDVKDTTYPCLAPPCKPNQETKVIRIDQPRVDVATDDIRSIIFKPGDTVVISAAGGCVQPGGQGLTWRSYADRNAGAGQNFYGTVWIEGTTGERQQSIGTLLDKTFTVPIAANPALRKDVSLQLGYANAPQEYGVSGYWGHDNGVNNQCKDVGPAWVEVKVNHQDYQPGLITWSPHSKPFDLVWDINHEDYNGLPLNPQWAFQLDHNGGLPDFAGICGSAFSGQNLPGVGYSGGDTINQATFARNCTSQPTDLDLFTGIHWCWGSCLCEGLINGHLNWTVATYTGTVGWDDYAGNWPHDGDYDLSIQPGPAPNFQNGYTDLNWSDNGEYGLGLEFKGGETLDRAGGPWWQRLDNGRSSNDGPYTIGQEMFDEVYGVGLEGVVTGLIGIDGVHGGYTESHPVFALAVRTDANQVKDGVDENWVFFLRNSGNEGECSENTHYWGSAFNNEYYIQLPWWTGATDLKVVGNPEWWAWQDGDTRGSILRSAEPGWTLIKVRFPNNGQNGVDGQFTIHYTVPAIAAAEHADVRKSPSPPRKKKVAEDEVPDISARISDPAVKAKFKSDLAALDRRSTTPAKKIPITVDTSLAVEQHRPGAASTGRLTSSQTSLDLVKKQQDEAMKKLLETYGSKMQPLPQANKQP